MDDISLSKRREREREREKRWTWEPTSLTLSRNWEKKAKKKNREENPKYQRRIRILPRRPDFPPFSLLKVPQIPKKLHGVILLKNKIFSTTQIFLHSPLLVTTKPNTTITITTLEKEKEREREREERERVENSSTLVVVVKIFSSLDLRVIFYARGNCEFFTPPFSGENITPMWNFIHLL